VANPNPKEKDTNYKFGLGLEYALTQALGLRAEAERYRINDAVGNKGDVDLFSVGLVFRFGGRTPAPAPAAAPAPARAPAAAPARQPEAVTPPPPARAVTPAPAPVEKAPRKDRN
jgi:OOP family OmpA-OmpF porin